LPRRFEDPFGNATSVDYDDPHDLLVVRTVDALNNTVVASNDYRVLASTLLTDPNGNRAAAVFDIVGLVAGTAVMGRPRRFWGILLPASTPISLKRKSTASMPQPILTPWPEHSGDGHHAHCL